MGNTTFEKLNCIDVSAKTETKNGLKYLSWAWAWAELKKVCPEAKYTIYENKDGWNYFTDGKTAWVKTGVEVDGIEYIEYLPVMDHWNKSIPLDKITSFDVNKSIQRSLTKAISRHGLGLYIYRGEDLPESQEREKPVPEEKVLKPQPFPENYMDDERYIPLQWKNRTCEVCGKPISPKVAKRSFEVFKGHMYCSKKCRGLEVDAPQPMSIEDIQKEIESRMKGEAN